VTRDRAKATLYKERQILTASPLERVIIVYDVALAGCAGANKERTLRALSLLRGALDWEASPDVAPRLQALYEFCEECVRAEDYETPAKILRELRDAWAQAQQQLAAAETSRSAQALWPTPATVGMSALSVAG